ncbi:unnamed protein product [Urochloa humidicola]
MSRNRSSSWHTHYISGDVLSHPTCADVEALTIEAETSFGSSISMIARHRAKFRKRQRSSVAGERVGCYKLSLGSVPSAALRVFHIAGCKNLTPPPGAGGFPCLEAIGLHRCAVSLCTLQDMIADSPRLTTLHLESVYIRSKDSDDEDSDDDGVDRVESCLCCPGVTSLVLANCSCKDSLRIEVHCLREVVPGLSEKWLNFHCLRGSLRRVGLQFRMDKQSSSFGTQLIKFFSERAMLLEEMYIDDGNRKMCEHINRKVIDGCTANASHPCSEYQISAKNEGRRRNRWSTSFKIIPLERYEERCT